MRHPEPFIRKSLAARSGVTEATLKRFENSREISLKHLLMLAVVLGATEEFEALFSHKRFESLDEVQAVIQNEGFS